MSRKLSVRERPTSLFGVVNNTLLGLVVMAVLVISISYLGWRTGADLYRDIQGMTANELQLLEESNQLAAATASISTSATELLLNSDLEQASYWDLLLEFSIKNYRKEISFTQARLDSMEGFQLHALMIDDLNGVEEHAEEVIMYAEDLAKLHPQFLRFRGEFDKQLVELKVLNFDVNETMFQNKNSDDFGPLARHIIPLFNSVFVDVISLSAKDIDSYSYLYNKVKRKERAIKGRLDAFKQQNPNEKLLDITKKIENFVAIVYGDQGTLTKLEAVREITTQKDNLFKKMIMAKEASIPYVGMLTGHANEQVDATSFSATERFQTAATFLVALSVFSLGVTILLIIFLPRLIRIPLKLVSENLAGLSVGNLTQNIHYKKRDEFGALAGDVNQTTTQLRSIVGEISGGISALKGESARNTSAAETLSYSISGQRNVTEAVVTSMSSMEESINEVSQAASFTKQKTEEAKSAAQKGKSLITDNISQVKELSNDLEGMSTKIVQVEGISESIGSIVDVIQNIAAQTNLLALNAAIEAARAGENGRGFAVVADEVRSLASKTASSTSEIGDMISNLQESVSHAVSMVKTSVTKMHENSERSNQTVISINEINEIVNQVVDLNTQVAAASVQQKTMASDIAMKIHQISEGTDQSYTAGETLADISKNLNDLAENQESIVNQFTL